MQSKRGGLRLCLGPLVLAMMSTSPSSAATLEELTALSGISTSESEALDKQADKLIEDSRKAKTDGEAASKAAGAKIDQKKLLEALKRGDKSMLFQETPESRHARELFDLAEELVKQAYQKAEQAAARRAHAALEQRCVAPSAANSTPSGDPHASPYLCGAVRAGGAAKGQNDPWDLCACMRRYLIGLQKDYESLQSRVQRFVGKDVGDGHSISTADVDQTFKHSYTRWLPPEQHIERATTGFEEDARGIQQDLARARIRQQTGGAGFVHSDFDTFLLSQNGAYRAVVNAEGALWTLYQIEARWQLGILRQDGEARLKQLKDAFDAADEATMARHPEFHDKDEANGFVADMEPLARQNDERDYGYVETTAQTLRALTGTLGDTHRRFAHDVKDWQDFAAKDGNTPVAEWPVTVPESVSFEIVPSRQDPVHCCLRIITKNDQAYDDPETHLWAHFPQGLLQEFPEMALNLQNPRSPRVVLTYSFESKSEAVSAVASGAGAAQQP